MYEAHAYDYVGTPHTLPLQNLLNGPSPHQDKTRQMQLGFDLTHCKVKSEWDGIVQLELSPKGLGVNLFSSELLSELLKVFHRLSAQGIPGLIIYSANPSGFSMGADLNELSDHTKSMALIEEGQHVFEVLSGCPFPSVAAIHGACFGGGCELALACTYRVASKDAQIGLPEVKLGTHPGWGGTARLPDLIGSHNALPLMINGEPISASRASELGLVDALSSTSTLLADARSMLYNGAQKSLWQKSIIWASNSWPVRQVFSSYLNWKIGELIQKKQYPAPFKIIDLWKEHGEFKDRLANEAASVYTLSHTATSKNLLQTFLLQESLKRGDKTGHGFQHIHIIGDTPLAGDLAALCAIKGFSVTVADNVLTRSSEVFDRHNASPSARSRLVQDLAGLRSADAVIEAVPDIYTTKFNLLRRIKMQIKHGAVLISTTGTFTIDKLSAGLNEDVVGMNFIDPIGTVPLVQIPQSYEVSRLVSFAKALGKLPIVVKPRPGLLINRILTPYIFEALLMHEEGIPPESIDRAAIQFGMPMGPLEYLDRVGLDIWASHAEEIAPILNLNIPKTLVNPSKVGKKAGQGIYTWVNGRPEKGSSDVEASTDRLMLSLVCATLAANNLKIANSAELIDGAVVFGLGFAPFLGGPVNYSKSLPDFEARVKLLKKHYKNRFETKSMDYFKLIDA